MAKSLWTQQGISVSKGALQLKQHKEKKKLMSSGQNKHLVFELFGSLTHSIF